MKYLATSLAIFLASALSVQAGEPVSATSLNAIGLGGMNVMSDAQGDEIRAKFVWGSSTASSSQSLFVAGGVAGGGQVGNGFIFGGIGGVYQSSGSASATNGYAGFFAGASGSTANGGSLSPTASAGGFSVAF